MLDMNDAELPRNTDILPDGSFVKISMQIRRGGLDGLGEADRGLLKGAKSPSSDVRMLDCEFTITDGPLARRKFWQTFTVMGGKLDDNGVSIGWKISKGTWRAAQAEAPDLGEETVRDALARFDPVWSELFPAEQERLIRLLVQRVVVGEAGAQISLNLEGLASLARDLSQPKRIAA
jgi:hypothetical protein